MKYTDALDYLHSNGIRYGQKIRVFINNYGEVENLYYTIDDDSIYFVNKSSVKLKIIERIEAI